MNLTHLNYPEHIQFHPTNSCNLKCIFCWRYNTNQKHKDLSDSMLLELTKQACNLKPKIITISGGGEPFLKADTIIEMMNIIKKNSINGVVITNGTLISSKLAKRIIESGLDEIQFSIESLDEATDDYLRGKKGALKQSIKGIKNVNKWKQNSKKNTLLIFRTIITKHNYDQISKLVTFAYNLSINKIYLRTVNEGECNFKGDLSVREKDYCNFLNELHDANKLAKIYNIKIEFEFNPKDMINNNKNNRKNCQIPYKEMVILGKGKASPCCNFFEHQFTGKYPYALIDATKANLKDIWFEGFQNFRKELLQKSNDVCKRCSQDMIAHNMNTKTVI